MIKKMILPLLKKFIGIFISMIFVSVLAISLLSGEASSIYNLSESYKEYKSDYKSMDIMISTDSFNMGDMDISNVEGIEESIYRYTLDIYFGYTNTGYEKIIYSRIYTYNDEDPLIKRYSYSKGTFNEYYLNISLAKKFKSPQIYMSLSMHQKHYMYPLINIFGRTIKTLGICILIILN